IPTWATPGRRRTIAASSPHTMGCVRLLPVVVYLKVSQKSSGSGFNAASSSLATITTLYIFNLSQDWLRPKLERVPVDDAKTADNLRPVPPGTAAGRPLYPGIQAVCFRRVFCQPTKRRLGHHIVSQLQSLRHVKAATARSDPMAKTMARA